MRQQLKKMLQNLSFEHKCGKYPNVPRESIPLTSYGDSTAKGLTKCILDFLTFHGHQVRKNQTGRFIDRREKIIDALGRKRVIGSAEWVRNNDKIGTADISATIYGQSAHIWIRVNQPQWKNNNPHLLENGAGIHFIASDFDMFFEWYQKTFTSINSFNG